MSNHGNDDQGKRGFVRPQQPEPPARDDFAQARDAFEAAATAHAAAWDQAHETNPTDETRANERAAMNEFVAARDNVFSTPATTGADVAFKFALFLQMTGAAEEVRGSDAAAWIMANGGDDDRAALTVYLDLLALSGVRASIRPAYADEAACPAAKIAREMEAVCAAICDADERGDGATWATLANRLEELEAALVKAPATSAAGAGAQLVLTRAMVDRARGGTTQALRDAADEAADALIHSALGVFGRPTRALRAYYLGDSDVSEAITDPDAIADRWIAARNDLQDEGGAQ